MVYSTRLFVVCLTLFYFVLVFFSPLSNGITSLGEERANLSAFRTFVRFVFVWFCLFPLPLSVCEVLRFCDCGTPWTFLLPFVLFMITLGTKFVCSGGDVLVLWTHSYVFFSRQDSEQLSDPN